MTINVTFENAKLRIQSKKIRDTRQADLPISHKYFALFYFTGFIISAWNEIATGSFHLRLIYFYFHFISDRNSIKLTGHTSHW